MDERAQALEALYRRRYGVFRDVLAGVVRDYESARDVVQEAFAVALRERHKYRGEGSLEAWVWRIALRLAHKSRRGTPGIVGAELEVVEDGSGGDSSLRAAIRLLPPQRRLILFLRYFADLSYAEIASACDVTEGTVGASLSQAREELQRLLAEGLRS